MKEPLLLPDLMARCEQCGRDTGTKVLFMKAGLGNACEVCGKFRKGKPYLSKKELNTLEPDRVNGAEYGKNT